MKTKIKDKEKIKGFIKEQIELCKKHNIYPIIELDIATNQAERAYYELDKLTKEERRGTY